MKKFVVALLGLALVCTMSLSIGCGGSTKKAEKKGDEKKEEKKEEKKA